METLHVAHAVTPSGVVDNAEIRVDDGGRVESISPSVRPAHEAVDLWAVPGFVDTHCHGAVGTSFGSDDVAGNLRAVEHHRGHGTTTLFGSTVTEPVEKLERQLGVLRGLVEEGHLDGVHLEGPFLAPERKGAHQQDLLRDPEPELVERLIEAGGSALRMITMAVERDHAEQAIRRFTDAGVSVAFGHSDADERTTSTSLDWGVRVVTHLFNAMRGIHHRAAGPVPVLVSDDRCLVELICDGVHVVPEVVEMAIRAAGVARVCLVTDAMAATGAGDGRYVLGNLDVVVTDGTARLATTDGPPGAIAGSTLTMDRAFQFLVQQVGVAIPDAAAMAASNPARWHRLPDVGELAPGRWADICLVDDVGGLHRVIRRGEEVPSA